MKKRAQFVLLVLFGEKLLLKEAKELVVKPLIRGRVFYPTSQAIDNTFYKSLEQKAQSTIQAY